MITGPIGRCTGGSNSVARLRVVRERYLQMIDPDVLAARPYWIYDAVHDSRTSPEHAAWDNLVLLADDPWWNTHYPPNGPGCRCLVRSAGPRELEQLGLSVGTAPDDGTYEWTDPVTGEVQQVPRGISPGWHVGPGNPMVWDAFIARRRSIKSGKRSDMS